jgi:hypothetical protein
MDWHPVAAAPPWPAAFCHSLLSDLNQWEPGGLSFM